MNLENPIIKVVLNLIKVFIKKDNYEFDLKYYSEVNKKNISEINKKRQLDLKLKI